MKKICILSFLMLFVTSTTFAGTVNLPKTGQTKCYNTAGNEIDCAGTGQDGEIQAGVAWPDPRFTDNGDGTMTDNLTGLMWTKNANLLNSLVSWYQALDYVTGMNSGAYPNFGYTDWCLPNVNELESLINAGEASSATWLNAQGFTDVQADDYWTSTFDVYYIAWIVHMLYGTIAVFGESFVSNVWPVRSSEICYSIPAPVWKTGQTTSYALGDDGDLERGIAWPVPRFTDHGNGTVTDKLTGLMWTKNANLSEVSQTWQQALDYVKGMNNGVYANFGYTDWRLPNRKELHSLTDYSGHYPTLPTGHPFTDVPSSSWYSSYWSSTTDAITPGNVWLLDMYDGIMVAGSAEGNYCNVWPVRTGEAEPEGCSSLADVVSKYNVYMCGQAVWDDVCSCYNQYTSLYAQGCTIDWSGYNYEYGYPESGSVQTSETSMTEQAALEARVQYSVDVVRPLMGEIRDVLTTVAHALIVTMFSMKIHIPVWMVCISKIQYT